MKTKINKRITIVILMVLCLSYFSPLKPMSITSNNEDSIELESPIISADGDGMDDDWEDVYGLDKTSDDSGEDPDKDGLTNIQEFLGVDGVYDVNSTLNDDTDPFDADSDNDYMIDGWEVLYGYNPLDDDEDDDYISDGYNNDETTPDSFTNAEESFYNTNPTDDGHLNTNTEYIDIGYPGVGCGDDPISVPNGKVYSIQDDGNNLNVVDVKGSEGDMGYAHGQLIGQYIKYSINWLYAQMGGSYSTIKSIVEKFDMTLLDDEIGGIYDACVEFGYDMYVPLKDDATAGLEPYWDEFDLWMLNTMPDWNTVGCAEIAVWDNMCDGNDVILGRNLNIVPTGHCILNQMSTLFIFRQSEMNVVYSLSLPGLISIVTGFNDKGLFMSKNDNRGIDNPNISGLDSIALNAREFLKDHGSFYNENADNIFTGENGIYDFIDELTPFCSSLWFFGTRQYSTDDSIPFYSGQDLSPDEGKEIGAAVVLEITWYEDEDEYGNKILDDDDNPIIKINKEMRTHNDNNDIELENYFYDEAETDPVEIETAPDQSIALRNDPYLNAPGINVPGTKAADSYRDFIQQLDEDYPLSLSDVEDAMINDGATSFHTIIFCPTTLDFKIGYMTGSWLNWIGGAQNLDSNNNLYNVRDFDSVPSFIGGGDGDEHISDIVIDNEGFIYITGTTTSTDTEFDGTLVGGSVMGGKTIYVRKYSPDGENLQYSSLIGGSSDDFVGDFVLDESGCVYFGGYTKSSNFPTTDLAYDKTWNGGNRDAYVVKLSADGSTLLYSTFIGGYSDDYGRALHVDDDGIIYFVGGTYSSNFPTKGTVYSKSYYYGQTFVSKFDPDLSDADSHLASTFIGGNHNDMPYAMIADEDNNLYITGVTRSTNLDLENAIQTSHAGGVTDGFVFKINSDLDTLLYSTYFGGNGDDRPFDIKFAPDGDICIAGHTQSTNLATTSGVLDEFNNGGDDIFICKLDTTTQTTGPDLCTYLGGSSTDIAYDMLINDDGEIYLTGWTESSDFPEVDNVHNGNTDSFVCKISDDWESLYYSTFIGGSENDYGYSLCFDGASNLFIGGKTDSSDFPSTPNMNPDSYIGDSGTSQGTITILTDI